MQIFFDSFLKISKLLHSEHFFHHGRAGAPYPVDAAPPGTTERGSGSRPRGSCAAGVRGARSGAREGRRLLTFTTVSVLFIHMNKTIFVN